jgi:hypothetical protein
LGRQLYAWRPFFFADKFQRWLAGWLAGRPAGRRRYLTIALQYRNG